MSRGWAIRVQGGSAGGKTRVRQKIEFWAVLLAMYVIGVVSASPTNRQEQQKSPSFCSGTTGMLDGFGYILRLGHTRSIHWLVC